MTTAENNVVALRGLIESWRFAEDARRGRPQTSASTYAAAALRQELAAVAAAMVGDRNNRLNRAAFALGQLIASGALSRPEVEAALLAQALAAGLGEGESRDTIRSGIESGLGEPRNLSAVGTARARPVAAPPANADNSSDPLDQDATAADLILANAIVRYAWDRWLPSGVLTILASEPGVGKTRLCADLARRVYHGLPWPDGLAPTLPKGSRTLWVPADNQHCELGSLPTAYGFPPEVLFLNATKRNPFAGTMLDDEQDLREFEARIRRVGPALVFVDTSLNATDRSSHKPEDAKAFFVPLQQIASRTGVVMLCATHLNAAGKPLGRRIMGQGRLVMQLEHPDVTQEHRRKLYVVKSNGLFPAPLGVTMGTSGNEYDLNPPDAPGEDAPVNPKTTAARTWLLSYLSPGPRRVHEARTSAEVEGINSATLYRAKDLMHVEEYTEGGRKWWRLPPALHGDNGHVTTPWDEPMPD